MHGVQVSSLLRPALRLHLHHARPASESSAPRPLASTPPHRPLPPHLRTSSAQGPYAKAVFVGEFGADPASLINAVPKEDFGGHASPSHGHADPNLTHAVELVAAMGLNKEGRVIKTKKPPPVRHAALGSHAVSAAQRSSTSSSTTAAAQQRGELSRCRAPRRPGRPSAPPPTATPTAT